MTRWGATGSGRAGRWAPVALAFLAAGCGAHARAVPPAGPAVHVVQRAVETALPAAPAPRCAAGTVRRVGSVRRAYAAYAPDGAVAYRTPGRGVIERFGRRNVNGYPTFFGVLAERVGPRCVAAWYRVQLPVRPNGATGWIRAAGVRLLGIPTRIVVDLSRRRLTLFDRGRRILSATVAVGSPATPTPTGRYYVNQRLVPGDPGGPFGPAALGISAYSPVLTGWVQGGPVAIHGTDEPWSIGHAVSNGCIRLPNTTLERVFRLVDAGTPVIIHA